MKSETTSPGQSYVEKVVSADFFGPRQKLIPNKSRFSCLEDGLPGLGYSG